MTLIRFDECISWRIVKALEAIGIPRGVELESAQQRDETGVLDIDWIPDFASRGGRLVISGDASMRHVQLERAALEASGLVAVFPSSKKYFDSLRRYAQAGYLLTWFPAILRLAEEAPAGAHYRLPATHSGDFDAVLKMRSLADINAEAEAKVAAKQARGDAT